MTIITCKSGTEINLEASIKYDVDPELAEAIDIYINQLQARVVELEDALEAACEDALEIPSKLEALHGPYISGGFGEEIAVSVSGMVSDIYHHRSEKVRGGGNTLAQSPAAIEARVAELEGFVDMVVSGKSADHSLLPLMYSAWHGAGSDLLNRTPQSLAAIEARVLREPIARIKDMLRGDDGQAWKEAEKYLDRIEQEGE